MTRMRPSARPAALAISLVLAACSTAPAATVDPHAGHAVGTGAPGTPHPSVPDGADGSVELDNEFILGGAGASVAEALEAASSAPVLVIGILVRDADGGIWFCDRLAGTDPPDCGRPRLWVTNVPDELPVFDPDVAASVGAQTVDGVTWVPDQQIYGVVHPAP